MHRTLASFLERSSQKLALSVIGGRMGVTVILAFSRGRPFPVWVAKVAASEEASSKLKLEQRAVASLRPFSAELNVPAVLEWDEGGERACLVLSGVDGMSEHFGLGVETRDPRDQRCLASGLDWLRKFRERVPVEQVQREVGASDDLMAWLEREAEGVPDLARLGEVLRRRAPIPRPVVSHGDFWCGNLLFSGSRIGVVDWEGLRVRDRFQDLFSLLTHCSYLVNGKVHLDVSQRRFLSLYFSESAAARFVRAEVAELRPEGLELRHAFYSFVADSIRLKGGRFRLEWLEILRTLDREGFPEPWSRSIGG